MNAFYKTFLSKNENYDVFIYQIIKLHFNAWFHIPSISFCYCRRTLWALVNGQISINALDSIPCCLPKDISMVILFLSPTSSFSLSTKSFPLYYKHAAISQISQTHLLKIILPPSPSSISLFPFIAEFLKLVVFPYFQTPLPWLFLKVTLL